MVFKLVVDMYIKVFNVKIYKLIKMVSCLLWLFENGLKNIWFKVIFIKKKVIIKWVWCVFFIFNDLLICNNVGSIVLILRVINEVSDVINVINLIKFNIGCVLWCVCFIDLLLIFDIRFYIMKLKVV